MIIYRQHKQIAPDTSSHLPPRHRVCFTAHRVSKRAHHAFSLVELLTVISIIALLMSLLAVAISSTKAKSRQTTCLNNLHQIGLGFTGFALNQEGKYPMDVPAHLGGSMEFNRSQLITNTSLSTDYRHFAALSNEVPNVKVMTCPADRRRFPAESYWSFDQENSSYWVNTKAAPHATASLLAGDWNLHNTGIRTNNIQVLDFGREVHRQRGSVLFADGRVEITRTLAYATPPESTPPVVVTPTPTNSQPTAARSKPEPARPRPLSPAPPQTASPPSSPPTSEPTASNSPTDDPRPETNRPAAPLQSTEAIARNSAAQRLSPPPTVPSENPAPIGLREPTVRTPPTSEPSGSLEPQWDTPGFRLFKLLAFAGYLISLLWALIALLLLYLRHRIAHRKNTEQA